MKRLISLFLMMCSVHFVQSQNYYFPPIDNEQWETVSPSDLGWCTENIDSLYHFLEAENTKAFILLKDGRIALERYFGTFTADSVWYWASAGKTLTAFTTGIAQREGFLTLDDTVQDYLGSGWTSCTAEMEQQITVRHQLTMTTALDDGVADTDCTLPSCLSCLDEAGNRWAYHNAPYTLLESVLSNATGLSLNAYVNSRISQKTGINGVYVSLGYNKVFFSKARSMARFGLLVLNGGTWDTTQVLGDSLYFESMVNTSNPYNLSYGYLWWLNGKESFMLPYSRLVFPGMMFAQAPTDVIAALGKNGQIINISASRGLVFIRMGLPPSENGVITPLFSNEIWKRLNDILCEPTGFSDMNQNKLFSLAQNPVSDVLSIQMNDNENLLMTISDLTGNTLYVGNKTEIDVSAFANGLYFISVQTQKGSQILKFVISD